MNFILCFFNFCYSVAFVQIVKEMAAAATKKCTIIYAASVNIRSCQTTPTNNWNKYITTKLSKL